MFKNNALDTSGLLNYSNSLHSMQAFGFLVPD